MPDKHKHGHHKHHHKDKPDDDEVQTPATNEQAAPENEQQASVQDNQQQVAQLEAEITDLKFKLGRLASDFEGYRNRTTQEIAEAESKGVSKAAEALMPVYDDLERAVTMGSSDPAKIIPGVQAVQNKVLSIFDSLGLHLTGKEGEAFDPQWHEAVQVVPGAQDGQIVQVYQPGFKMGDKLVRPARVVVSRKG